MKSSLEKVQFSSRLRDVHQLNGSISTPRADEWREREHNAFERGRREGERSLNEQLLQQRSELLQLQQGVLESLRQVMPQLAQQCQRTLVELALEAAQKLVAGLPISSEMVEAAIEEALASVGESQHLLVLLHPSDLELLERANSPMRLAEVGGERLRFQPDASVSRGGCVVQTQFGSVDGRRETKLKLLKAALEI